MAEFISTMAADSKYFLKGYGEHTFKGCLGVCLSISNSENFQKTYADAMETAFSPIIKEKKRLILKSNDVSSYFSEDRKNFVSSLGVFLKNVAPSVININCVFTTLNPQILPDGVKIYGYGRFPSEFISPIEFLDKLNSYYPYIAAWKVSKFATLRGTNIFLDHFTGEYTKCWGELCAHHNVWVVPSGDLCNSYISSADLITRYIDEYLSMNWLHLVEESIHQSFNELNIKNFHVFYVGHSELEDITPMVKGNIDYSQHYPNPMIYILKEEILKSETKFFESSPSYNNLVNFASLKNAGLKFISYDEDFRYIKKGDYLVYLGKTSEDKAKLIESMGYEINVLSIRDVPK